MRRFGEAELDALEVYLFDEACRLKQLKSDRRCALLVCFLHQLHADTIDFLIEKHDKLMTGVYSRAENNIAKEMQRRRTVINRSLASFHTLGTVILDDSIDDSHVCQILFKQIDKEPSIRGRYVAD